MFNHDGPSSATDFVILELGWTENNRLDPAIHNPAPLRLIQGLTRRPTGNSTYRKGAVVRGSLVK